VPRTGASPWPYPLGCHCGRWSGPGTVIVGESPCGRTPSQPRSPQSPPSRGEGCTPAAQAGRTESHFRGTLPGTGPGRHQREHPASDPESGHSCHRTGKSSGLAPHAAITWSRREPASHHSLPADPPAASPAFSLILTTDTGHKSAATQMPARRYRPPNAACEGGNGE